MAMLSRALAAVLLSLCVALRGNTEPKIKEPEQVTLLELIVSAKGKAVRLQDLPPSAGDLVARRTVEELVALRFPASPAEAREAAEEEEADGGEPAGKKGKNGKRFSKDKKKAKGKNEKKDKKGEKKEDKEQAALTAMGRILYKAGVEGYTKQLSADLTAEQIYTDFLQLVLEKTGAFERGAHQSFAFLFTTICNAAWKQSRARELGVPVAEVEERMPLGIELLYQTMRLEVLKAVGSFEKADDLWKHAEVIHGEMVEKKCEAPSGRRRLSGPDCWVSLFVRYLTALRYPGALSAQAGHAGMPFYEEKAALKCKAQDKILQEHMLREARGQLGESTSEGTEARSPADTYSSAIVALLAKGEFPGRSDDFYVLWTALTTGVWRNFVAMTRRVAVNEVKDVMPVGIEIDSQNERIRLLKEAKITALDDVWVRMRTVHNETLEGKCEVVEVEAPASPTVPTTLECWVQLFVYYLGALKYPGALSMEHSDKSFDDNSARKYQGQDRILQEFMRRHAWHHAKETLAMAVEVDPSLGHADLYTMVIVEMLRRGAFTGGADSRFYNLWAAVSAKVYRNWAFLDLTREQKGSEEWNSIRFKMPFVQRARFQELRLNMLKEVGVRQKVRDGWAIAIPLCRYTFFGLNETERAAEAGLLRCYIIGGEPEEDETPDDCSPVRHDDPSLNTVRQLVQVMVPNEAPEAVRAALDRSLSKLSGAEAEE